MSPNETNEAWRRNMDMRLLDKAEPGHLLPIVSRGFCLHHRHHEGWDEESKTTSQYSMTENSKCKVSRIDTEYIFEWLVNTYYYIYIFYKLSIFLISIVYFSNPRCEHNRCMRYCVVLLQKLMSRATAPSQDPLPCTLGEGETFTEYFDTALLQHLMMRPLVPHTWRGYLPS